MNYAAITVILRDVRLCPHLLLSSPGSTARPSTPRPIGSSTTVSGILDLPHARVMALGKLFDS